MMCGRHPYEGVVGVCAPCLRDRLLALAAAQNEAASLPPPPPLQPEPEPELLFPRSVSPYVCRRNSDASGARGRPPGLLFFRTPQVGPAYGGGAGFEEGDIGFQRRRSGRLSVLAALFGGHQSHRSDSEEKWKHRSWLAGIMPRGRLKKEPETAPPRRSCRAISNRGLSPVRYADGDSEESTSPAESPWLPSPSPMRKTPGRRRPGGAVSGVSGFAVCISPLARPSPGRHHRGGHPPDAPAAIPCELRPPPLRQLTSGTSLPHCRSWKLADGGRFR
ncbi:uncharacterized protein LOC133888634 [Phragmites australis]|uniref:uncharacterized protein LOC133888634 n=1 Tax=Phragmites australis TaxID=29695 RepID=UPI002D790F31|nr:uncharacterized protein LOC133888634 [Phragmites australis]